MARRRSLGKGLDALIPGGAELAGREASRPEVPVGDIRPNPRQPRAAVDPGELRGLTDSIRRHGLLQPLLVSAAPDGEGYVLIAGQRRLEAARAAGLRTVPVIVRQAGEQQRLELAMIENLQRTDLLPLEAAEGYRQLAEDFGLSHDEVAAQVGKSRSAVSNTLRLLKLAPGVKAALAQAKISEGHARALLGLPDNRAQESALRVVLGRELSVRHTEELVRRMTSERPRRKPAHRPAEELDLEARLETALGTRVNVKRGPRGGRLVIHFFSDEELNALADRLLGEDAG
jgi:ParB family chromosome partitioning protein